MAEMEKFNNKWIATVASIWIQCSVGASYTFGIYSSVLKSSQSYSQSTLDTVSVFKDIGANAGVISGLLYSAIVATSPGRRRGAFGCGPWMVLLLGAFQFFGGYFLIWASVVGLISKPPVAVMCLFMWVAAHGQTFFNTTNVVSGVHNFSDYSGTIVGIMKGFLGLSGAILVIVYQALCKGEPSTFILMLAVLPTLVSLLLMCFVRIYKTNAGGGKKHLNSFSVVALVAAAYLMIVIILENIFTFPLWLRIITFILLLLILASPLRTAIQAQREDLERFSQTFSIEGNPLTYDSTYYHELPPETHQVTAPLVEKTPPEEKDMNILQAICTVNFWLLFIAMVCGMGSGMATINNISQIGESLSYSTVAINTLVSLWSIWNFLGRFGAGYLSDLVLHTLGWPRPYLMVLTLALMTAGHIVIALGFPGNLYIGSILVGVCYGSLWSLMPIITSEIFGVRHMGTIFNSIAIGNPVGSYILSVRIIGYLYDKEASSDDDSCYGTKCFELSFLIMASVTCFGFLVALAFSFRTKQFYELLVLKRLQANTISTRP